VDTLHGPIRFSMPAPFLKPLRRIGHLATSRSSRIYALAWDLVALDVMTDAIAHATLRFATTSSAVESTDKGSDKATDDPTFRGPARHQVAAPRVGALDRPRPDVCDSRRKGWRAEETVPNRHHGAGLQGSGPGLVCGTVSELLADAVYGADN
jgi:hypothetical protein